MIYIWLKYVLHTFDILSIYDQQTIYIWISVGRFESWSSNNIALSYPSTTTLLCDKSYNFFGFIIITQTFFTNQTLTYILFLMSCSNETNENSFFFQGFSHI
jgi:hypothetical protein